MKQFVEAIFYFDLLLTGADLEHIKTNKNDFLIIQALINQSLKKDTNVILPPFICDCFEAFTQNKKQINLNVLYLEEYGDKRFNDLLFHSLHKVEYKKEFPRNDDDPRNLVRSEMLSIFPNVETLIIQSTGNNGYDSFSFSLMALLSHVLNQCNLNQIII